MIKVDNIINSIFTSQTYLLHQEGEDSLYLIDCGDVRPIEEYILSHHLILKGVLLTHTHFDHIYGLNDLVLRYQNCTVYTSANGKKSLYDDRLNMSGYQSQVEPFIYHYDNVSILHDEDFVPGTNIKVIATPGHDWSCLSYQTDKYLFSGDSYIPDTRLLFHFPKSNRKLAIENRAKLISLAESEHLQVMSGHYINK